MSTWIEYNFNSPELENLALRFDYAKPLHMTLVHFPRNISATTKEAISGVLNQWVRAFPKQFIVQPNSLSILQRYDGGAIVQPISLPQRIYDQRLILLSHLFQTRIVFSNNYDWNPHVTVGNMNIFDVVDDTKPLDWSGIRSPVKIMGVSLHHSFGNPHRWWLKP